MGGCKDWTPEEDALVLDLYPKGRRASAAVRLRRSLGSVDQRYVLLTTPGANVRKGRVKGPMTQEMKEKIALGWAKAKAERQDAGLAKGKMHNGE